MLGNQAIENFMTKMPHSIEPHQTLETAKHKMRDLGCHHLPVLAERRIIGILSERDILFLESFDGIKTNTTPVLEAMIEDPLTVGLHDTLSVVSKKMFEARVGSALVVDSNQKLAGIFTTTDALKALSHSFS